MKAVAVCCGFNNYDIRPLGRAVNDAALLYARLTESRMFNTAPELIGKGELFTQRTSASAVLAAFTRAATSTAELVWFSFSGHATVAGDGTLRLLLPGWRRDADEDHQRTCSIGADEIERVLRSRLASKRFVVVLDACHSGAFGNEAITRDMQLDVPRDLGQAIEEQIASAGAVVISSCARDQLALDGVAGSTELNGAFSAVLIELLDEHLRTGRALSVLQLFLAARGRIDNGQVPTLYTNGLTDDFLILADDRAPRGDIVDVTVGVPKKLESELTKFLSSLVQICERQRVGLVHAERQLEGLAAEFYKYGDDAFVVSRHNSNVAEAFDSAQRCIIGCTTPEYLDEWRRSGVGLLEANREFLSRRGGRVVRLFLARRDSVGREPLLGVVRDHVKAGVFAVIVDVDSFGPAGRTDLSSLECAFIDGNIFLGTHFAASGDPKIEVDQRPTRCQNEYRTLLRPFLTSHTGVLYGVGLHGKSEAVVLHEFDAEDISELRQQIESDLAVGQRAAEWHQLPQWRELPARARRSARQTLRGAGSAPVILAVGRRRPGRRGRP